MARPRAKDERGSRELQAQRILATVDAVPRGKVATYGQIAAEAGLPRRARLVGKLLGDLPKNSRLPWHRIVNAQGRIAQRPGGGPGLQRRRLRAEGVPVDDRGKVELKAWRWLPGEE